MFCKWCGKKITNNGVPCPSCGKNQDILESGNGFWDLCNFQHEVHTEKNASNPVSEKVYYEKEKKLPSKSLQIVTVVLLALTILLVGVGLLKMWFSLSELSDIGEFVTNISETTEEPDFSSDESKVPSEEETNPASVIAQLEDSELIQTDKLVIERFGIDSDYVQFIYIVSGEMLEEDNAEIYWQVSADGGETWQIVGENIRYIVAEESENAVYRVVCAVNSDSETTYYYATTDNPVIENQPDKNEENSDTSKEPETKPENAPEENPPSEPETKPETKPETESKPETGNDGGDEGKNGNGDGSVSGDETENNTDTETETDP